GKPLFFAHSWGHDFVEFGYPIALIKEYFMNKTGQEFLKDGDVIAICGFTETPADDWGCDMSTRGTVQIGAGSRVAENGSVVVDYSLSDNYPNPFNPTTSITYTTPIKGQVRLVVYNTLGQAIHTLVDEIVAAGKHTVTWNGANDLGQQMASGVYFYTLETESFYQTKKMMLIK
ncbi:T9SS type A sorting domain-containing protein, partial [candidate division KSB1 bacterium]|nr:T9SS type A sorting domain-containing protein [candidate division KSB1 bacterium]